MKRIGMIGTQLIHEYLYAAYFNGFDPDVLRERGKPGWVKQLEGKPSEPASDAVRISHVWAGDRDVAANLAASCRVEHLADSPHEFINDVDGVMVMDEEIEQREHLMRPFIEAGKPVYVDKILSLDPAKTEELLALAAKNDVPIASWSQLRFSSSAAEVKAMPRGGICLASFRGRLDILPMYAIHLVSPILSAFGAEMKSLRFLPCADGVEAHGIYADDTRVVLYMGPKAPPQFNICYFCADGCSMPANNDGYDQFFAAGRLIEKMVVERTAVVAPEEISAATRIVRALVEAKPGDEIALA